MGFFDASPPPEPSERPSRRLPAWAKPETVVPGVVAVERVLARSDDAAVAIGGLAGYPNGFEFTVAAILRVARRGRPILGHHFDPDEPVPDRFLRLGVEFSDGRRATNLAHRGHVAAQALANGPTAPMLMSGGGGGSAQRQDMRYWVWPLPPPGPLAVVCEWPAYGIGETRTEIDAALIIDAAARAVRLWPDDPDEGPDDGSDDGPVASVFG